MTATSPAPDALFDRRRLGFGGAPLGNLFEPVDDAVAEQTLAAAWRCGLRYYDTAPLYGAGLSEQRLGRFLQRQRREEFVVSTKVGRLLRADVQADAQAGRERSGYVQALPFAADFDYSAEGVYRSIDDSLRRLGLARIDIAYLHDIDVHTHGSEQPRRFREAMAGAYPALARLREQGVLRAIGLGVNEARVCVDALRHGDFDAFMLAGRYTLLDGSAEQQLIPACAARGVKLVVAGAFNSGILASGAVAGARYDYAPASAALLQRVARIDAVGQQHGVPLRAAALQFSLGCAEVAQVMVGLRSAAEVVDAVAMFEHPIPEPYWRALHDAGLIAVPRPAASRPAA